MKVKVEFGLRESRVIQDAVEKYLPICNATKNEEVKGAYGSVNQTVNDGMITLDYKLDGRVIPGIYNVIKKHSAQLSDIVMMAKGLFQTYMAFVTGFTKDLADFNKTFKAVRRKEMADENDSDKPSVVEEGAA